MAKINKIGKINKIVVNIGLGRLSKEAGFEDKILPSIFSELALITGQKPESRPTKRAIAGFKSRLGQIVGARVTIRGKRAHDFLKRVVSVALPRSRDFRGLDLSCVGYDGNLNIGIREHLIFPEINPENSKTNFGMQISVVLEERLKREEAINYFRSLGVPLKIT